MCNCVCATLYVTVCDAQTPPEGLSPQLLQMALWSCIQQLRAGSPEEPSLPWVHRAYQHFRIRLQNFSRILTIHPPVLHSLATAAQSQDPAGPEMVGPLWEA